MKSLTTHKFSMVINIGFATCLAFAAHGSANVFDDAVFWFRGGKDKDDKGKGYMQKGEFFDDLHADDDSHGNHKMSMTSYTGQSIISGSTYPHSVFAGNGAFAIEQVVFPSLGTNVVENMQVLRLSNDPKRIGSTGYYFPFVVNPHSVFDSNNISNEYTVVSRIKLNDDGVSHNQCFLRLGYNETTTNGMWLGFTKPSSSWYSGCYRIAAYRAPNSGAKISAYQFNLPVPTNTWVDLAVVVGDGKLRVGVAAPVSLSSHNNNPTIAFDETGMWTDNCPLLSDGNYRMFCLNGQTEPKSGNSADKTYFVGSVQQMAIWGRALEDQDVMAAFGMPRPAIFRMGFENGVSTEFGGERSGTAQTIDGLGSWQGVCDEMLAGDTWTVNFTALRDEAGLPQIFSIKSLSDSAAAQIEPILTNATHNVSLTERRVAADGRTFWPVPADLITEGANTLILKRKDGGAGTFKMDAMELGGSLGVGKTTGNGVNDQRVYPKQIELGVPAAADPNTQHWPIGLQPYVGITNLQFRVWVDPDVVDKATSRFWTQTQCANTNSTDTTILGNEEFRLCVNGTQKTTRGSSTDWDQEPIEISFQPGELKSGWNDFNFISDDKTCHWLVRYYRFETVLRRGFSIPPPGMRIIVR